MANKKLFKTIGAITTGALVLATPSCTDTWDDHYNDPGTAAGQNLWEQIESNPKLSTFAEFAKKAKYYRDNIHPVEGYTYADMLKSGQVMTVWAPENSAFTAEEKAAWTAMCEQDGYNFQVQFMSNHIALWRHNVSFARKDTLFMINGKRMIFDKTTDKVTMYDVELIEKNIEASNGTLHIVKDELPFHYNLYEFIKFSGEVPIFQEYMVSKDTTYFQESASIEGLPDENGNPTYVDSVYYTQNLLFGSSANQSTSTSDKRLMSIKGMNAYLPDEGGKFIMAIPTDKAWKEAEEMLKPYYVYGETYIDRDKSNAKENVLRPSENVDSLTDISIKMDITAPLVYHVERQGKIGGEEGATWTEKEFIKTKGNEAEYLLTQRGDTIRSIMDEEGNIVWDKTNIFNGELREMSNGYAYLLDKWDFPIQVYRPDIEIKTASYMFNFYSENFKGSVSYQTYTNSQHEDIIAKYGRVSDDHFYILKPDGSTKPEGDLRLENSYRLAYTPSAQVMSGKYDIYMVMVPYWYKEMVDKQNDSLYLDSAYVDSVIQISKNKIKLKITYDDGSKKGKSSKDIKFEYDGSKVDTILCVSDFEFPVSYKNLEHSYPVMTITSDASNSDIRKGYVRELCIDRVILRAKADEPVVEEDPS